MKKLLTLLILTFFAFTAVTAHANAPWRKNKLVERKKRAQIEEQLEQIPIYREKLNSTERDYDIVATVFSQDALTGKRDTIIFKMREQAYKHHADAIMEFKCKAAPKNLYQTCEGFAIKWK